MMTAETMIPEALFTTGQIARLLDAQLLGDPDLAIGSLETIERAGPNSLSFIRDDRFLQLWQRGRCGAAIISRSVYEKAGTPGISDKRTLLLVADADQSLSRLLHHLSPPSTVFEGIDATAVVDPGATIGDGVAVGPHAVIGPGATIGATSIIHSGVVIGAEVSVGVGCTIHPNVVIYAGCEIGDRCVIHAGAVIGADGFGYLSSPEGAGSMKIPHIGNVRIGRDVEIGASTCVDRAKFGSTVIGDGTKIDNLVQVGHGCHIGRSCLICGVSGLAGSVELGDRVTIAGCVGIADGMKIGSGATVGAKSGVMRDVPAGETWLGYPAFPAMNTLRQWYSLEKLPGMLKKVQSVMQDEPRGR